MTQPELELGLKRAADELGQALQNFEGSLDEFERNLNASTLDALEAALPGLMSAARTWRSARQWVDFYRRMGQDRIRFLEDRARGRRWYDPLTLGVTRLWRRRRLESRARRYQGVLESGEQALHELDEREGAALDRVREFQRRVDEARRQEEERQAEEARQRLREALGATEEPNRSGTLTRIWEGISDFGPLVGRHKWVLARAALVLLCVSLGVPPDPASLFAAAAGALA
jgi:hypothetical protein